MSASTSNNLRLGAFVMAGLLFLILILYMIGRNSNVFISNFQLRTQFRDAKGLQPGNNVRFAGTQIGTVKKVQILNDTTIEILFYIEEKNKVFIRKNSLTSIGSEGLVGNKVLNISPSEVPGLMAEENDILPVRETHDIDEMLETLYVTNNNVAIISEELKNTVHRFNNSTELWELLGSSDLSENLRASLLNIRRASAEAMVMVADVHTIISDVKKGEGSVGTLLKDTTFASNLNDAVTKIKLVGDNANLLADELNRTAHDLQQSVDSGKGTVNALLKDTVLAVKLNNSLSNIEKGTAHFNENMESLKHNFLFRGYFKKIERQQKKANKNLKSP